MQGTEYRCLLIGGVDPTCGAGVFADYETCLQAHVHASVVVSANTIQNHEKFYALHWVNKEWMKEQLKLLLQTNAVRVVKIGIIENPSVLLDVLELIHSISRDIKIVWDPIRSSTSNYSFYPWTIKDIQSILPHIYLITPNRMEFDFLCYGMSEEEAIEYIGSRCNLLVKSFIVGELLVDDLLLINKQTEYFKYNKQSNHSSIRGTGCRLASGIAAFLANGVDLRDAYMHSVELLNRYTYRDSDVLLNESTIR